MSGYAWFLLAAVILFGLALLGWATTHPHPQRAGRDWWVRLLALAGLFTWALAWFLAAAGAL